MGAAPPGDPSHLHSHRRLLRPAHGEPAGVDAIIVPTNRSVSSLTAAIGLAAELDCLLVVLCSRWSSARDVFEDARRAGARIVTADVPPRARLPRLESDAMLWPAASPRSAELVPTVFPPDTSMKRNLGLAVAHMMRWSAVLFLDDDITAPAHDVRVAAGLLRDFDAVGLENTGYPDHSVVYHARGQAGEPQDTFIGGGALLVSADCASHFPNVYNEDWFFLFEPIRAGRVALSGRAEQREYDPFDRPSRARDQEFGDCVAEGLFSLLDVGRGLAEALDPAFWRAYLTRRAELIAGLRERSRLPEIRDSLRAAEAALADVHPELCVKFLAAWQSDRATWSAFRRGLPRQRNVTAALEYLGLSPIGQE